MAEFLFLLPYLVWPALSIWILIFTWRHRSVRGAIMFTAYMMAQTLWAISFIFELVNNTLNGKILWDSVQWVATAWLLLTIPPFVVNYQGYTIKKPKLFWGLLCIVPGIFLFLLFADRWLHTIYVDPSLVQGFEFLELKYSFTPLVYIFSIYGYIVTLVSIFFLLQRSGKPSPVMRAQVSTIAVGILIPLLGTVAALIGLQITPQRDPSPFTFTLSNLVITYGLFRFKIFNLGPVARSIVFENIPDFVVVMDNQNHIVDINQAAIDLWKIPERKLVGHPFNDLGSIWPELAAWYPTVEENKPNQEFKYTTATGAEMFFKVEKSAILDWRKRVIGYILVGDEITESKNLEILLRKMTVELEERVRDRTRELAEAYDITLEGWARALELRDKETEGHSRKVTELSIRLARMMELDEKALVDIRRGALLHDIGKMGIPDEILRKPSSLTDVERKVVEEHPEIARRLLAPIEYLRRALEIPYSHHERWNGSGYPEGMCGKEIPLSARIFAVVDVWDAMRTERPYHPAYPDEEVRAYILSQAGVLFDPEVVSAFIKMIDKENHD